MSESAPGRHQWQWIYRHPVAVRVTHWVNVVCLVFLLGSGLAIFNAHPSLYWGNIATFDRPLVRLEAVAEGGKPIGRTTVFGVAFTTTGFLGLSRDGEGQLVRRGFPSWATIPSYQDLSTGRRWHFVFAWLFGINGAIYLAYTLATGHARDLVPTRTQWRTIGRTVWDHLRLRFPHGPEARGYNVLQRASYFGIAFIVLPVLILAGLAMSPGWDAAFPWLPQLFGGRQSARTVHFICAGLVTLFAVVHVLMVLVSGVWNNLRSMITGRYRIEAE